MSEHAGIESITSVRRRVWEEKIGRGALTFIVGMQFGSEGKGAVAQYLAPGTNIALRTGAPNAGHTVFYHDSEGVSHRFVMQQIPCGWINPLTELVVGPSALIKADILERELRMVEEYLPVRDRLRIDEHAQIITPEQVEAEQRSDLAERIGSTSARSREGIGQAASDKVLRKGVLAKNYKPLSEFVCDTVHYINTELDRGVDVLLEGTQGFDLGIDFGTNPFTTSRNVNVSSLADSAGISQNHFVTNTIGVVRAFPIRVAGNSGPFAPDSKELTWEEMREITGNPNLQPEMTSVTGLKRRIATFSDSQYVRACEVNRPTEICLTFADYLDPAVYMSDTIRNSHKVMSFIDRLESLYPDAPVTLVNTGPNSTTEIIDMDDYRRIRLRQMS